LGQETARTGDSSRDCRGHDCSLPRSVSIGNRKRALIHNRLESLIDEMLEGQILLDEALCEFEKLYIKKAMARHKQHISNTAAILGIHRNTLAKRVAAYQKQESPQKGPKRTNHKKLAHRLKAS
jgi:DNA-binding NtrC family response regulator